MSLLFILLTAWIYGACFYALGISAGRRRSRMIEMEARRCAMEGHRLAREWCEAYTELRDQREHDPADDWKQL